MQAMTQLLEQAIEQVKKLPTSEQDAIASLILEEIADERRWDVAFAGSQPQLARLAEKVRNDIRAGKVRKVGMDEL
jgi:ribosome biogenesis GTPase A